MCEGDAVEELCVHRYRKRETKTESQREWWGGKRQKGRPAGVCSCGGQLRGSSSPLGPSLAPARSLRGSLGSWGKTSQPPSPLNPALGCLPWPGCLTALLMLHTGTQGPWVREGEGAGAQGERREEEERWGMVELGGWRTRDWRVKRRQNSMNWGEKEQIEEWRRLASKRCEGASVSLLWS